MAFDFGDRFLNAFFSLEYDFNHPSAVKLRGRGLFLCSNRVLLEHPFYNTKAGREVWDQLPESDKVFRDCKLWLSTQSNKVMVGASIELPQKFNSFLNRSEALYQKYAIEGRTPLLLKSVDNFRQVTPTVPSLYRSATLDELSEKDALRLLNLPALTILDLRNSDEIRNGQMKLSSGSTLLYDFLSTSQSHVRQEISILQNVDKFWDKAIDRMPFAQKSKASLQNVFEAGALDRAAALHLEQGGLPAFYTVMLESCGKEFCRALKVCHRHLTSPNQNDDSLLLFHCQKGKDRTGVLAMLLQHCLGDDPAEIIQSYGVSGELLGESAATDASDKQSSSAFVDWSHFRGSPEQAMKDSMAWVQETYGSLDAYLDFIGFPAAYRRDLQEWKQKTKAKKR